MSRSGTFACLDIHESMLAIQTSEYTYLQDLDSRIFIFAFSALLRDSLPAERIAGHSKNIYEYMQGFQEIAAFDY